MRRYFLIGARGSGKSSVGKLLARTLGLSFLDLDVLTEDRAGKSIASFVAEQGWPAFRELERAALASLVRELDIHPAYRAGLVLATGGGAVLDPENRRLLRSCGRVYWLQAPAGLLLERVSGPGAGTRPPLTGLDPEEEMARILAERAPFYAECAHYRIDASRALERVVEEITALGAGGTGNKI